MNKRYGSIQQSHEQDDSDYKNILKSLKTVKHALSEGELE